MVLNIEKCREREKKPHFHIKTEDKFEFLLISSFYRFNKFYPSEYATRKQTLERISKIVLLYFLQP